MNLLIPDPYNPQSYFVILGLKHICSRIVSTTPCMGRFSRILAFTSNSRHVNANYNVADPRKNWEKNIFADSNTDEEERYIMEIERICEIEKISLIYPTSDPMIYLFSRNLNRFRKLDIEIPVPDCPSLVRTMDKYEIISAAKKFNIAAPRTFKTDTKMALEEALSKLRFPLILKPRFGSTSIGVCRFDSTDGLLKKYNRMRLLFGELVMQEFIPGNETFYFNILSDNRGRCTPASSASTRSCRPDMRIFQGKGVALEAADFPWNPDKIFNFISYLGVTGYMNIQFKTDSRNNELKLMEVNPKLSYGSWIPMESGFNLPLANYNIFKGKDISGLEYNIPKGVYFLCPTADFFIFVIYIWCLFLKYLYRFSFIRNNTFAGLPSFISIIRDYRKKYFHNKRRFIPLFRNFLHDPLVSLAYGLSFFWGLILQDYPHNFQQ